MGDSLSAVESTSAHQCGEPGLLPAPKLTDVYHTPILSTYSQSVNPSEAEIGGWRPPGFGGYLL